jgi:predicted ATPase
MRQGVLGRDNELRAVGEFVAGVGTDPSALVIVGEPGIGKTTVWRAGVEQAEQRALRVLAARPAEGEATLSYSALGDLLRGILDVVADELPVVQREALGGALLLAESKRPLQQRAVAAAVRTALISLGRVGPVLVAVDDAHWPDQSSAQAFSADGAARRISRILIAGTRRSPAPAFSD